MVAARHLTVVGRAGRGGGGGGYMSMFQARTIIFLYGTIIEDNACFCDESSQLCLVLILLSFFFVFHCAT